MKTIAVISQKGGAGKTTLALHLAAAGHAAGLESLILDTDPQATASAWSTWRDQAEPEVIDCASPPLLARKLDAARELGAELIVIDTPPHADSMATAACRIADLVLIPCRPRGFDLAAIELTGQLVKVSGKAGCVVFTAGPAVAPKLYAEAEELVRGYGLDVAPFRLSERAAYHHATGAGKVAAEIDPNGKAAGEVAALWGWIAQHLNVSTRKQGKAA